MEATAISINVNGIEENPHPSELRTFLKIQFEPPPPPQHPKEIFKDIFSFLLKYLRTSTINLCGLKLQLLKKNVDIDRLNASRDKLPENCTIDVW